MKTFQAGLGVPRSPPEKDMPKFTLEKIAELTGVSRSTVSRVINHHPRVSGEVRARVLKVIAETGYQPNRAAQSLARRRTFATGNSQPTGPSPRPAQPKAPDRAD